MKVVGIDQSYSGLAICGYDSEGHYATCKAFPLGKYDHEVQRLEEIFYHMYANQALGDDTVKVCMEGYAHGAKFGREQAGELGGTIKLALWMEWGIIPVIVPPTSLKKYVLGKAATGKNLMLKGVYKKWDVDLDDDNLADAYALSRIAWVLAGFEETQFQYEREVLQKLKVA